MKITPFQNRVYEAIKQIPKGEVTTYKLLAEHLQCRSSQAVGQALKRNPFAPEVPCHRVVKSDLTLGGYQGEFSPKKESLLKSEGVTIVGGRVNEAQLFNFGGTHA